MWNSKRSVCACTHFQVGPAKVSLLGICIKAVSCSKFAASQHYYLIVTQEPGRKCEDGRAGGGGGGRGLPYQTSQGRAYL